MKRFELCQFVHYLAFKQFFPGASDLEAKAVGNAFAILYAIRKNARLSLNSGTRKVKSILPRAMMVWQQAALNGQFFKFGGEIVGINNDKAIIMFGNNPGVVGDAKKFKVSPEIEALHQRIIDLLKSVKLDTSAVFKVYAKIRDELEKQNNDKKV